MNALAALGLVLSEEGRQAETIVPLLGKLEGVPGRLQYVGGHPAGAAIYVDYAHKPAALENVLKTLRPHAAGRLICVFGCGGDRDRGKRPLMGQIAAELADIAIVTDDNPRGEEPAAIRAEILKAAPDATEIGDRRDAIREAVRMARAGDVVLIAGKGHETGQYVKGEIRPFDDVMETTKAIEDL